MSTRIGPGSLGAQFEPLGRLVFTFSMLEGTLAIFTATLLSPERTPAAFAATRKLPFRTLLDVLGAVATETLAQQLVESLSPLLKRAENVNERRNRFVHSFAVPGFSLAHAAWAHLNMKAKRTSGIEFSITALDSRQIEAVSDEVVLLFGDFIDFMMTAIPLTAEDLESFQNSANQSKPAATEG